MGHKWCALAAALGLALGTHPEVLHVAQATADGAADGAT